MTKIAFLFTLLASVLFNSRGLAQPTNPPQKDSPAVNLQDWLTASFSFQKPAAEFTALAGGTGYACEKYKATIKYITMPGRLSEFQKELRNEKPNENSRLIDSVMRQAGGKSFFVVIREEVSPDKSKYENMIFMMIATEQDALLVCVIGVYPKSLDRKLRKSFIQSGLSISKD